MFKTTPLKPKFIKLTSLTLCAIATASLAACGIGGTPLRSEVAARLSAPAWMVERQIPVAPFNLTAFERMHERGQPATLYIEGDGTADNRTEPLYFDPTPTNPVALHLASKDKSINLAYLARPCQLSGLLDPEAECDSEYWHKNAFTPETINAYNTALNKMKRRYGLTGFNIVGYDSGATLAAILAASRNDVFSLRTVSGEFDLEKLVPLKTALLGTPQHHFTGGHDANNTPAEIHGYLQMLGPNTCTKDTFIQEATHETGWVDKWPELLREKTPVCVAPMEPDFTLIETPEPIFYPRMAGDKK